MLAVIVVLAVIMVIATQQVNRAIARSRSNAFIESFQMVVKQVKMYIVSGEDPTCGNDPNKPEMGSSEDCFTKYNLSKNDYNGNRNTYVRNNGDKYQIQLQSSSGKFKNLDLAHYGDVKLKLGENKDSGGKWSCEISGVGSAYCYGKTINASIEK